MNNLEKLRQICRKSPDGMTPQDALDGFRIFGDICQALLESGELTWEEGVIMVSGTPSPIPDDQALTAALPNPLQEVADAIVRDGQKGISGIGICCVHDEVANAVATPTDPIGHIGHLKP